MFFFFFCDEPETRMKISWWNDIFFPVDEPTAWVLSGISNEGDVDRDWIGVESEDMLKKKYLFYFKIGFSFLSLS